jgi:lipopolysaccharide heptosyltransferase II
MSWPPGLDRVLCVRLDTVGDVLMTTPAMRALKKNGSHVTLLTSPAGATVGEMIPEVDEVIVYEAPWMKATPTRTDSASDAEIIARLAAGSYDAAVIFTVYSQNPLPTAFLCHLAGIPRRLAHCRENPYQLLTDWVPEKEPELLLRHEVRRQLDLVAAVGHRPGDERLSLEPPEDGRQLVAELLKSEDITDAPWAVLHPGATAPSRRYRPAAFARVAHGLLERGWRLAVTGAAEERPLADQIRSGLAVEAGSRLLDLTGRLDLGALAALLERAPLLISNNTGPVHMAAAVGTPVVDLYALTNPQHTPWAVPNRVLSYDVPCKYCYKSVCPLGHNDCLQRIEPEDVVRAALELAAETRSAGRPPHTG